MLGYTRFALLYTICQPLRQFLSQRRMHPTMEIDTNQPLSHNDGDGENGPPTFPFAVGQRFKSGRPSSSRRDGRGDEPLHDGRTQAYDG